MKKEISNEELDSVSGGAGGSIQGNVLAYCPKCYKQFDCSKNYVNHGSGCVDDTYKKCPYCGHEFK